MPARIANCIALFALSCAHPTDQGEVSSTAYETADKGGGFGLELTLSEPIQLVHYDCADACVLSISLRAIAPSELRGSIHVLAGERVEGEWVPTAVALASARFEELLNTPLRLRAPEGRVYLELTASNLPAQIELGVVDGDVGAAGPPELSCVQTELGGFLPMRVDDEVTIGGGRGFESRQECRAALARSRAGAVCSVDEDSYQVYSSSHAEPVSIHESSSHGVDSLEDCLVATENAKSGMVCFLSGSTSGWSPYNVETRLELAAFYKYPDLASCMEVINTAGQHAICTWSGNAEVGYATLRIDDGRLLREFGPSQSSKRACARAARVYGL